VGRRLKKAYDGVSDKSTKTPALLTQNPK